MTAIDITVQVPPGTGDTAGAGALLAAEIERQAGRAATPGAEDIGPARFALFAERHSWLLVEGGAPLHINLDRGMLAAADRFAPFCDLRLFGASQTVLTLVRQLDGIVPLRISALTPVQRGERLIAALPGYAKAEQVALSRDMDAVQGFREIACNCIHHYRLNEDLLHCGYSEEALHQARVAIRRLRSAFSIFRPMLGAEAAGALGDELRWLAQELAEARDLDVLVGRLRAGSLRGRLLPMRDRAHERVLATLRDSRSRLLMVDLAAWLQDGDWLQDRDHADARASRLPELASGALDRYLHKMRKFGRDLAKLEDSDRHELRKMAKKLRYAADFFAPICTRKAMAKPQRQFLASLASFQDLMGVLNDRATAPILLEKLGVLDDPEAAFLLQDKDKRSELKAAVRAHQELLSARPFWR
ncbi:CHAD domain-containing protein [Paracoccus sp. CPCC 101403]|uniref:CHAD domain-containing protein n=1 Tax=Paracoccus broussonetiae TaxID=3075834 RepID=A0ABU3ECS4_9RHOB|nr:CHAD domain-containing protein [Paracoccus sp. CPCC 101403]MDT1062022.1 CHAD domain-containing protein [Paracoccus sp. CPCC 101403]